MLFSVISFVWFITISITQAQEIRKQYYYSIEDLPETVLIPEENAKDLAEIPRNILRKLDIHPVSTIDEVLEIALVKFPKPLPGAVGPKTSLTDVPETETRPH